MSAAEEIRRILAAWRKAHGWQPGMAWDPRAATYEPHTHETRDAGAASWYCELCEQMHPIGAHVEPGAAWPPAPPQPPRPSASPDSDDIYRCHCGFHLFADPLKDNELAARHRAHVAEFQQQTQRLIGQALCGQQSGTPGHLDDAELSALAELQRMLGARVIAWPQGDR